MTKRDVCERTTTTAIATEKKGVGGGGGGAGRGFGVRGPTESHETESAFACKPSKKRKER